jgi:hypothetical protein
VNALLAGVVGVAATLLGSASTYVFQSRTAGRAEAFARGERLRQEQLTACSAFAGALTELKRGLVSLWFHRQDPAGETYKATRVECDRLGASAEAARFRVQLVADDPGLLNLADAAFSTIGGIRTAANRSELTEVEKRFEDAVRQFIGGAAVNFRAAAS